MFTARKTYWPISGTQAIILCRHFYIGRQTLQRTVILSFVTDPDLDS